MLQLRNVNISYKGDPVLRNVSLTVRDGEKVALIGPSGAGKTTLLRKLYEFEPGNTAFIHQDFALVPQLTAFHNVFIGRLDRHSTAYNIFNLMKPKKQEIEGVARVLDSLAMRDKMFERVARLSGGQQQRVAVARAIYRGGDILLGDEPVSSIDPHQADSVLKLLLSTARTVIVSLHSVQFALQLFDRIIGLRGGEVRFDMPGKKVDNNLLKRLYEPC